VGQEATASMGRCGFLGQASPHGGIGCFGWILRGARGLPGLEVGHVSTP
jgi:hypothetical protein